MTRARLTGLLLVAAGLAACSSTAPPATPAGPAVSWGQADTARNPAAGPLSVATICGSATDTYLAELLHHSPTDLKVMQEWGDVVPDGEQVVLSGTVATVHQGPGDLPIDHPEGDDLSMDVKLDASFVPFSQKLGSASTDVASGAMHVEISSGFIPHVRRPSTASPTQTWQQLSEHNLTGFQPGFAHPAIGDRVLVEGRYIIDCGHPDFHTELHPISFLAWAERDGGTTVVRFYENPYRDTEYYSPDLGVVGLVGDTARFAAPNTTRFPKRLITEVVGILAGRVQQLDAFELVGALPPPAPSWQACAQGGTAGGTLHVNYDLVVRPGVSVSVTPSTSTGCATVNVSVSPSYTALNIATRSCVMPWSYLNGVTAGALAASVDAQKLIQRFVPAKFLPVVNRSPLVACADSLAGPTVTTAPNGQVQQVDATQPFPVYGVITLTRQ